LPIGFPFGQNSVNAQSNQKGNRHQGKNQFNGLLEALTLVLPKSWVRIIFLKGMALGRGILTDHLEDIRSPEQAVEVPPVYRGLRIKQNIGPKGLLRKHLQSILFSPGDVIIGLLHQLRVKANILHGFLRTGFDIGHLNAILGIKFIHILPPQVGVPVLALLEHEVRAAAPPEFVSR
jgi:hypothetical protein